MHEDNEPVTAEVNQSETMDDNAYYQESAPENIADSQPVLTNGISEQSQEAAMDQDNDAPSPTLEEHVEQGSSLPAASPVPETDVGFVTNRVIGCARNQAPVFKKSSSFLIHPNKKIDFLSVVATAFYHNY